jgi:hypothetical protein
VHGAVKGTYLAGRRLLRCHPWTAGGYDPVPGTPEFDEEARLQAAASPVPTSTAADELGGPHDQGHHDLPEAPTPVLRDDPAPARSEVSDQRAEPAHVRGVNCPT